MGYYTEYCAKNKIEIFPKHQEIIDTFYEGNYRELVAVLGRRSGKDMLAINIALKELEYLLGLDDPFKYYKLAKGNPIYILIASASADQSRIMLTELKSIVSQSENLKRHLSSNAYELDRVSFLSDADIRLKKSMTKQDASKIKGSIVLLSGNSNSDSLLGKRFFTLIFNDVASFKRVKDSTTGDRIYFALCPTTMDFKKPHDNFSSGYVPPEFLYESKIVSISTPRHEGDMLHKLYTTKSPRRMAVCYPTWKMNPNFSEEQLRKEFNFMSDEEFRTEFGAEFIPDDGNKTLSMRLSSTTIDKLKRIAREEAYKSDKDVSYTDMIRCAIDEYVQKVTV